MNDRMIMEDILQTTKGTCDLYMHGTIESATPNIHSAFDSTLGQTLTMQQNVYNQMAQNGWYPTEQAQQQRVTQVKQKFSGQQQ